MWAYDNSWGSSVKKISHGEFDLEIMKEVFFERKYERHYIITVESLVGRHVYTAHNPN